MSHLNEGQLIELRDELERQLRRLERSMKLTDEAAKPVELDQTAVGRLSRMDALQNQHLTKNLQEREAVRFALIHDALKRIDTDSYGLCSVCGAEIEFDRLWIYPETPVCSDCG